MFGIAHHFGISRVGRGPVNGGVMGAKDGLAMRWIHRGRCGEMNASIAPHRAPAKGSFQFVQAVVSPRARGLSVRLNLNPDGRCNFQCAYCEVDRSRLVGQPSQPDVVAMMGELATVLEAIEAGRGGWLPGCEGAPAEYLKLGHVALSGSGEPTLCPVFEEVVEAVMHLRAQGRHGYFKVALITNSTALEEPGVRRGLRLMTSRDEIWAKLDAGTPEWFRKVNGDGVRFEEVLAAITSAGRRRPLVLQGLFPRLDGRPMPLSEQEAYGARVAALRRDGARIDGVQVYSATRPSASGRACHAGLGELSNIARAVREAGGVAARVF
jgi:pyruvate-formate lyase-activating enzyme